MGQLRRVVAGLALAACGREAGVGAVVVGEDCGVLIAAGERAMACDPAIAGLLAELRERPDERRCRAAARELLAPAVVAPRIYSVYEAVAPDDAGALTAGEREALRTMVLPGTLRVTPDLAPGPGVPETTAELGGAPLAVDGDGRLHATRAEGRHTLVLRHANGESRGCVTLRACEVVDLTAHGAELAPHASWTKGACP